MRRFELPEKKQFPSRCFFINIFKRAFASVIVDTEEKDIFLILSLKNRTHYFSVRQFIRCPTSYFPVWARKKCLQAFYYYFS